MKQYKIYLMVILFVFLSVFNLEANDVDAIPVIILPMYAQTASWSPVENIVAVSITENSEHLIKLYRVDFDPILFEEVDTIVNSTVYEKNSRIQELLWSPDGKKLLVVSVAKYRVYDTTDFSLMYELPNETVVLVTWSPDSASFVIPQVENIVSDDKSGDHSSGFRVNTYHIIDAETGNNVDTIYIEDLSAITSYTDDFWVTSIDWSTLPPNRIVFRGRYDIGFQVNLDDTPYRATPSLQCCGQDIYSVQWQPNGNYVATNAFVHDMVNDEVVFYYPENQHYYLIEWHPSGQFLATTILRTLDIIALEEQAVVINIPIDEVVADMTWSSNGRYLMIVSDNQTVTIWDLAVLFKDI
jgi:WD40 repeat protein